jgi:hypothetical protein
MSDAHVVLVTADLAPWDSDSDSEVYLFEFSGPDQAKAFQESAQAWIDPYGSDVNVAVYDPQPVTRSGNPEQALETLKGWLDLEG